MESLKKKLDDLIGQLNQIMKEIKNIKNYDSKKEKINDFVSKYRKYIQIYAQLKQIYSKNSNSKNSNSKNSNSKNNLKKYNDFENKLNNFKNEKNIKNHIKQIKETKNLKICSSQPISELNNIESYLKALIDTEVKNENRNQKLCCNKIDMSKFVFYFCINQSF